MSRRSQKNRKRRGGSIPPTTHRHLLIRMLVGSREVAVARKVPDRVQGQSNSSKTKLRHLWRKLKNKKKSRKRNSKRSWLTIVPLVFVQRFLKPIDLVILIQRYGTDRYSLIAPHVKLPPLARDHLAMKPIILALACVLLLPVTKLSANSPSPAPSPQPSMPEST